MEKFRALVIYAKSLVRQHQGTGELLDLNHIFYEAERLIKKNGWEKEAEEFVQEEFSNLQNNYKDLEQQYIDYVKSGERNEFKDNYFRRSFHKLGVDGRFEVIAEYKAKNGKAPSADELVRLMNEREAEDRENARVFAENQVKIANGEDFDSEALKKATKALKDRGLYTVVTKAIPVLINSDEANKTVKGYEDFDMFLY